MGAARRRQADELRRAQDLILKQALELGLDPFRTVFELVSHEEMSEIAAYGGFPTRYPHWRFGMDFDEIHKGYSWGLSKIYELVINNDPCYAYLMRSNPMVDQKMVIAHVYGHSDFFKNNLWFGRTNRRMIDQVANHATRIRRHAERHGIDRVERFLDACLSLENLVDPLGVYGPDPRRRGEEEGPGEVRRLKAEHGYMDRHINPPEYLAAQRRHIEELVARKRRFPEEPARDVLGFLLDFAPLEPWQQDVLGIVREEALYFAPQAMTKIMNEGWATYWHAKIMSRVLKESEVVDFADHHSGTLATRPGVLNPYKLGVELWRSIEERWDTGRHGPEYDACDDLRRRREWDSHEGRGLEKIFEVRRIYNDLTFVDEFLTREFCQEQKLFAWKADAESGKASISDRDFGVVKRTLLDRLTHQGHPVIEVEDGNHRNRGELLLRHAHAGADLDLTEARDTLKALHELWRRPVTLQTRSGGKGRRVGWDGEKYSEEETS